MRASVTGMAAEPHADMWPSGDIRSDSSRLGCPISRQALNLSLRRAAAKGRAREGTAGMRIVRVNWAGRRRLKRYSKALFRRLVMDRETEKINSIQDAILFVLIAATSVAIFALGFYLSTAFIVPRIARVAPLDPASVTLVHHFLIAGVFCGLYVLAALLLFFRWLSDTSYNLVGFLLIMFRRMRPGSASAEKNIADVKYWLRSDPRRVPQEVRDFLGKSCADLLPKQVTEGLEALASPTDPTTALLCRGLFEKKYRWLYMLSGYRTPRPGETGGGEYASYFILSRALRNAIKMSICFDVLEVDLRDEAANGSRWWWDYYSKMHDQHVPMWDRHNLPLRFRSARPHLRWPDSADPDSDGEIPLMGAFSCLENPMNFRIHVLSIRDVISELPSATTKVFEDCLDDSEEGRQRRRKRAAYCLCLLANRSVHVVGHYDSSTMQPQMGRDSTDKPLLHRLDGGTARPDDHDVEDVLNADWGARWDPNRIVWSQLKPASDGELLAALGLMIEAVDSAMRARVTSVRLTRGDVLFVDNQRCLVGRFEREITRVNSMRNLILQQPGEWWLRRFYGFRSSQTTDWAQDEIGQRYRPEPEPVEDEPV